MPEKNYLTIAKEGMDEFVEKKSRFIGRVWLVETEEEALARIQEMKKQHYDATHNCWAYVIRDGAMRFSDDGEPHGTAGKPILEVINGLGLVNVAVVVTRYFGGVLLGTGGLVRAYSKSTKDALESATVVEMVLCTLFSIECEYQDHAKLLKLFENSEANIENTNFNFYGVEKGFTIKQVQDLFGTKIISLNCELVYNK